MDYPVTASGVRRAQKILYKRAKNKEYQSNPLSWLCERFDGKETDLIWSLFPGYENHQWDGTRDPFFIAINAIKNGQDVGCEAATGVGKTYIAARIAYWFLDTFPESAVITTSPTKAQLLQVLWKEIGLAFSIFKKNKPNAQLLTGEVRVNKNDDFGDELNLVYSNRMISRVGRKRAGEDSSVSFQGIHNKYQLFILDEAAGLEHSVITAIKNTNTFKGQAPAINSILAIGNPDSVTDGLHQFCKSPGVIHIRVSAYDHPNVVMNKAVIPGAVTRESLELRKKEYGEESNLFRSRGRGIAPEQATDALIMRKWIDECSRFTTSFNRDRYKDDPQSFPAVGVDVANSVNGDAAALAWGKGSRLMKLHEFQCPDANVLADNLIKDEHQLAAEGLLNYGTDTINDYGITADNIGVDGVGVGVATVNQFSRMGLIVRSLQGGTDESAIPKIRENTNDMNSPWKPLYKFANLRAQMWFQARIDLQRGEISIDVTDLHILNRLAEELTMVRYKVTDGHIVIEKKDSIKERMGGKSPNLADAFVYWNWVRKRRDFGYSVEMPVNDAEPIEYESNEIREPDQSDFPKIWGFGPGSFNG
jgi:phage terminase large subunit